MSRINQENSTKKDNLCTNMHKRNPVFRIPFVLDVSVCFQKLLGKFFHRIRLSVNGYLLGHQVEVVLPEHDFVLRN